MGFILFVQNLLVLLEINVYYVSEGQGGNRIVRNQRDNKAVQESTCIR